MNARSVRLGVLAATVLAASACATAPERIEGPHHYSRDADGNRIACYTTDVANEYECVPVRRRYASDPYWDPYYAYPWVSFGFYYGWPHDYYDPYPARPHPGWGPPHRRR